VPPKGGFQEQLNEWPPIGLFSLINQGLTI
jgi:hypothetical protein